MRTWTTVLMACAAAGCVTAGTSKACGAAKASFRMTIDRQARIAWGLRYPVTYVFELPPAADVPEVRRRDAVAGPWATLPRKTAGDGCNGVECVRWDPAARRAYVSVGFGPKAAEPIEMELVGVPAAKFVGVAPYYDGRKAAYTLSIDNWGCNPWAHPGAPWQGTADDASDCYQAAVRVCRGFRLPVSVAVNSRSAGGDAVWQRMQEELDRPEPGWEPAVHGRTHPKAAAAYQVNGYREELLGCREDILKRLTGIPYGQYVLEHILTHGYEDEKIFQTDAGVFLFVRGFNWHDNPTSVGFAPFSAQYRFYGVGGLSTKGYDAILERREPKGRYFARDVAELNAAFDRVHQSGGIFYGLWHPDRFRNSVLYDPRPGVDGVQGSTLMQHLAHVANRNDVWYVANGWMYSYRYVAENVKVSGQ